MRKIIFTLNLFKEISAVLLYNLYILFTCNYSFFVGNKNDVENIVIIF